MKKCIKLFTTVILLFCMCLTAFASYSDFNKFESEYTLTANQGENIASIAFAQLEKNKTELGFPDLWCAMFVTDCAEIAGVSKNILNPSPMANAASFGLTEDKRVNVEDAKNGDLVFWYCNICEKSKHVGIYVDGVIVSGNNGGNGGYVKKYKDTAYRDDRGHYNTFDIRYYRPDYTLFYSTADTVKDGGTYYLVSSLNEEKSTVAFVNDSTSINENPVLWERSYSNGQKFTFVKKGEYYSIINVNSGLALAAGNEIVDDAVNVQQQQPDESESQLWLVEDAGDGYVSIKSAFGKYLDVYRSETANGTKVQTFSKNDSSNQKWKLVPAFYLDINGTVNGESVLNIKEYGTADVYINGELVADDAWDYYVMLPSGTEFEIKNIKANSGYEYTGAKSFKGAVGSTDKNIVLDFKTDHEHVFNKLEELEHPHKQYKICMICGLKEYTGAIGDGGECEECHEHVYVDAFGTFEKEHPHRFITVCECGAQKYTGEVIDVKAANAWMVLDCSECHTHNLIYAYDTAHPHMEYRFCMTKMCDFIEYTGNSQKEESCEFCQTGKFALVYDGLGCDEPPLPITGDAEGSYVTVSDDKLERDGYTFLGWSTQLYDDEPEYIGGDRIWLSKNMILFAVWRENEKTNREIILKIDSTLAYVDGKAVFTDAFPIIVNDRTMLPARFVAENLGAVVEWDGNNKIVTVKSNEVEIKIFINDDTALVNGREYKLDSPAFISNSRTYIPVRFVSEHLGATVTWDDVKKQVKITK